MNLSRELTHLDLFSGIGGFAIAARNAGFRTIGFSEVEPYACQVLAEKFPGVRNFGDVRKRRAFAGINRCTVLTGGYPCQPFSFSGVRRGQDDHRHLWPAMRDIISDVRPAWVIAENVIGHVTMGLDSVLSDLEGFGYSAQPVAIPACAVGAKHIRERVWILANTDQGERRTLREDQAKASSTDIAFDGVGPVFDLELLRAVHGIPAEPHTGKRCGSLGNAIVPQVAEVFFQIIAQIERGELTEFPT